MIHVLTIIGARPQIIKASAISRTIKDYYSHKLKETIIHTGQHYDHNMSQIFFDELGIPTPEINLKVNSASHGIQTAKMISGIEEILISEKPDYVLLYGDTNSTLAGSLAASKLHIPVIHVEAGLRSFNKSMPEEINRIICDHTSSLLFSPTNTGFQNLLREGFSKKNKAPYSSDNPGVFHCGDVMYDNSLYFADLSNSKSKIVNQLGFQKNKYLLATIHRDLNTDKSERLSAIFKAFIEIAQEYQINIVIPLHPRTSKILPKILDAKLYTLLRNNKYIKILEPVSFLDMIQLEKNAMLIITDSGGVQKEAYFFNKACIILRPQTEWVEILNSGNAMIADANTEKIKTAFHYFSNKTYQKYPLLFGSGHAAEFICQKIIENQ
jgi:UDP-GlcNAc3NAcA epimerase